MTTIEKIRAEIENTIDQEKLAFDGQFDKGLNMALQIINKYAEQEPTIPCDLCGFKTDKFEFCEYLSDCPATGKAVSE